MLETTVGIFVRVIVLAMMLMSVLGEARADWRTWRGPTFNGVAGAGQSPVTEWGEEENVIWKVALEGSGHSSPTIVGDRIFLTAANEATEVQSVVCFDRATGKLEWKVDVSSGGFPSVHRNNTHASPSVVSDGTHLFASFCHDAIVDLICLTLEGKKVWQREIGPYDPQKFKFGYGPSPFLHKGLVLIGAECEMTGYLAGLDQKTGAERWRTPRPTANSYSSPVVVHIGGRDQLVISGGEHVTSYDPMTGKTIWEVDGTTIATSGTVVWDGDLVFASGGYPKAETVAVDASGSGKVVWTNRQKIYEQSMLAHEGYIYALTDSGSAYCWRAKDGEEMWKERLRGPVSASPVLVGDAIYVTNEKGTTYVFKANPAKFEMVAENQLGKDVYATMSVVDSRIYMRTGEGKSEDRKEFLYCIGKE